MGGAGGELPGSGALGGSKVIFEPFSMTRILGHSVDVAWYFLFYFV
jgi:hypothetical protein